jgi:hypothetical protein
MQRYSHHTRDRQKICKKMAEKAVIVEMAMRKSFLCWKEGYDDDD